MRAHYDSEFNVLSLRTGVAAATEASLLDDAGIVLELAHQDGYDIVGLMVMGAPAYVPHGYDAKEDILRLGRTTAPELVVRENGDFIGYWQADASDPSGAMDPVGVVVRNASKHLASVPATELSRQSA